MKLLCPVALTALLCVCAEASAEEPAPTAAEIRAAAEAFDSGRDAYKRQDHAVAADYFEEADSNAPSAAAIELAIRSRDKAGQLDRAATLSALALQRHPDERNLQKLSEDVLARAKPQLHELKISCEEPCDVVIGTKLVHGRKTSERTVFLEPGQYTVRASFSDGRSTSAQTEELARGSSSSVHFDLPALPLATDPTPSSPRSAAADPIEDDVQADTTPAETGGLSPTLFWVGLGLTAVAGGVTTWSGIDTLNNPGKERVQSECEGQGTSCPLYQEGLDNQRRTNVLIGVTAGLGAATLIVGAFLTDWSSKEDKQGKPSRPRLARPSIEPWITVGAGEGAAVGARGRF